MSQPPSPLPDREKIAEELYNASCEQRNWRTWDGKGRLPSWAEFRKYRNGEQQQQVEAWLAAADRANALLVSPAELQALKDEAATPATLP